MNRNKLESFIGKKVEIEFFDSDIKKGTLYKGKGLGNNYYDSTKLKWYFIPERNINFRLSHVRKIKEIKK